MILIAIPLGRAISKPGWTLQMLDILIVFVANIFHQFPSGPQRASNRIVNGCAYESASYCVANEWCACSGIAQIARPSISKQDLAAFTVSPQKGPIL